MGVVVKKKGGGIRKGGVYIYAEIVYNYTGVWVGHPSRVLRHGVLCFPLRQQAPLAPSFGLGGWVSPSKKSPRCE